MEVSGSIVATSHTRRPLAVILKDVNCRKEYMNIENLSADNIIKLIIAEQIVVLKEKQDFEGVEKRLNMLELHYIK